MSDFFLGIEGGGTRTVALLVDAANRVERRVVSGPCNLRLVSAAALHAHFRELAIHFPSARAIGIGLAGCRDAADRSRVETVVHAVWPGIPHRVGHDLETAWHAAFAGTTSSTATATPQIIVVAGTGSCCYGKRGATVTAKVGGWGHLLGDCGSGYDIAFTALRDVVAENESTQRWPRLGARVLRRLQLTEPADLISWIQTADKTAIASLAPEVFAAAQAGDRLAKSILTRTQAPLAAQATQLAHRLSAKAQRNPPVEFVLCGSVFTQQPTAARNFAAKLRPACPQARVRVLTQESVWGAVALAHQAALAAPASPTSPASAIAPPKTGAPTFFVPRSKQLSPTEERNPRSAQLDKMPLRSAIQMMLAEEARIPGIIEAHAKDLARLIEMTARVLRNGGRLFYLGAGTSGRLGVLDASECPPTFRSDLEQVQGIMAGGEKALHSAVEGAEDNAASGAAAIEARGITDRDLVLGIAASGRTPFVWGALATARRRGARTALLCFNPHLEIPRSHRPDVVLALNVGPEVLTGSTRLKAGTATKLVLNLLTTLAMVRIGKVIGNLMIDLNPSNDKLRDRAARIVMELTGCAYPVAWAACEKADWQVGAAVRSARQAPLSRPKRPRASRT